MRRCVNWTPSVRVWWHPIGLYREVRAPEHFLIFRYLKMIPMRLMSWGQSW